MRALIVGVAALLASFASFAQAVDQEAVDRVHQALLDSADYLHAGEPDPYSISSNQQFAGLLGREDLIPTELNFHLRKRSAACGVSLGLVLETLMSEAAKTQIVILNEAHIMPMHRAGVIGLVDALVTAGFTHYAYESFGEKITDRPEPYIRADDVFYSNDPLHARLLRRLKARGVTLIAYEKVERSEDREVAQALNLKERVFDKNPSAKLIVVGG